MIERAADLYFGLFPDATIKSMFDEAMLYAQGLQHAAMKLPTAR